MVYNQTERGVYAPGYYKDFKCIAGKCKHSCCVDWEICIDEETLEKYKKVENIIETVIESDEGACFKLTGDSRCPHLDESGLCKIIISHGEDYLSEICSNHPRFFNNVSKGRVEVGLGIVCEEACYVHGREETDTVRDQLASIQQICQNSADTKKKRLFTKESENQGA